MARFNPYRPSTRYNTHRGFGAGATDSIAFYERQRTSSAAPAQPPSPEEEEWALAWYYEQEMQALEDDERHADEA